MPSIGNNIASLELVTADRDKDSVHLTEYENIGYANGKEDALE